MRRQLLFLLPLCCGISASASTIETFEIANSSSFRTTGGIFTSGGGTSSASFPLDVSQLPGDGSEAIFGPVSFNIFTDIPERKAALSFLSAHTRRRCGSLEAL
jgi:hypothetical protein